MGHMRVISVSGTVAMMAASLLAPPLVTLAQGRGGGDVQPFTLNLLVQDPQDRQAGIVAQDLVRIANEVSDGRITIVPTFDGTDVASAVRDGSTDLGIVPSRDWDAQGVTSFDALEAPFLVHDDALAEAIATSDFAPALMAGLDAVGVTGLSIWPEDLRHLFAFNASGRTFDTPESVRESQVLVVAGKPGNALIPTLGGTVYEEGVAKDGLTGDRNADAISGALTGMITGLWGAGLPTGDVTVAGDLPVYSKFQTLVASGDRLASLTSAQRDLLDQVVSTALTDAVGRHFAERDLAMDLCASGATVTEIGPAAIAAFRATAKPLTDELAADPVTGGLMADIAALDASTPDAPGAGTCSPTTEATSPSPGPDTGFIGDQLPPDGAYRTTVTTDELRAGGSSANFATVNAGTWTWSFASGQWSATFKSSTCAGSYAVDRDGVRFVTVEDHGCGMDYTIQWRQDGEDLTFRLVGVGAPEGLADNKPFIERTWDRVGEAPQPSGDPAAGFIGDRLPPNGTWRIQHTADELVAAGVRRTFASDNAGIWTLTFEDAAWRLEHEVPSEHCAGSSLVADDVIRLVTTGDHECTFDGDMRWRLDEANQLYLTWLVDPIAPNDAALLHDDNAVVGGPWTPVQ